MNDSFPPYSRPIDVEGGVQARSRRGAIGQSWWSGRFLEVLRSALHVGGRLERGKHYARRGQVIDLDVGAGLVTATVQGSRRRPYRVRLTLTEFVAADWAEIESALAQRAWYSAKLLAGEMPEDIEDLFAFVGLSLFPTGKQDLSMRCSCPDATVPCKHLAAVCYLLAESFDDDPFTILAWRGRDREALLDNLRALRGATGTVPDGDVEYPDAIPLPEQLDSFYAWQGELAHPGHAPHRPDAVLDELPPLDITIRGRSLPELLRAAYRVP